MWSRSSAHCVFQLDLRSIFASMSNMSTHQAQFIYTQFLCVCGLDLQNFANPLLAAAAA